MLWKFLGFFLIATEETTTRLVNSSTHASSWCVSCVGWWHFYSALKQKVQNTGTSATVPSCRRSCWASPPPAQPSPLSLPSLLSPPSPPSHPSPAPARPEPCSPCFPPPWWCDCSSGPGNGEEINHMAWIPDSFPTMKLFEANKLPICSRLIGVNANRLTFHKLNTIWQRGSRALRV